jgi:predicted RNA-binding Zn ribbon-like protein
MRTSQSAPGRLEVVREFVNTRDIEEDTDELANVAGAAAWLRTSELAGKGKLVVTEAGRRRLISFREALRELLLAGNRGEPLPKEALAELNQRSAGVELGLRFDTEGAKLYSACEGTDGAVAELLTIVAAAMRDGNWQRLKACPAEDCRWAFYDRSRNRSATWCQMGECGNRSKARAFRARRRRLSGGE